MTGSAKTRLILCILLLPLLLQGEDKPFFTYHNFLYGARSLAMGNAFVAVADDLTAVYRNPAGIAFFQFPSFYANSGGDKFHYRYELQERGGADYEESYDYKIASRLKGANTLAVSAPLLFWQIKWNFALAYYRYMPSNFRGNIDSTYLRRGSDYLHVENSTDFSGSAGIDVLAFSSAFFLLKDAAFGITLQKFFNTGTRIYQDDVETVEYPERITGHNYIFGLLFRVTKGVRVGLAYHTPLKGELITSVSTPLYLPARFAVGTALELLKLVNLSYEFSQVSWSKGTLGDLPYPSLEQFTFNQRDMVNHRLGFVARIPLQGIGFSIRGGLSWERQLFSGADGGDVWLKGYALGCGIHISRRTVVDLAYAHRRGAWPEPGYFDPATFVNAAFKQDVLSLSVTYTFTPRLNLDNSETR